MESEQARVELSDLLQRAIDLADDLDLELVAAHTAMARDVLLARGVTPT